MTTMRDEPFIRIDDPDDPRIAFFRSIRERDLARDSFFVAEGTVVVESLLRSPFFRADSFLILANRVSGLAELLAGVPDATPIFVAERHVLDAIAGFPMHRGVLAAGMPRTGTTRVSAAERLRAIAARGGFVVAAVGIANHDNMGAIFRNARAFGAEAVLLDPTSCDPLYRKSIRVSAGGVLQIPFARMDTEALADALRANGFRCYALSPRGKRTIETLRETGPAALFLGAEGRGLPDGLIRSMVSLRIDMSPGFDSLNVATAGAIAMQRLYSARRSADGDDLLS